MPIKVYTKVYPKRKINDEDEKQILAWVNTTIEKMELFEIKYNSGNQNIEALAAKILETKCFRCHANGNDRGGFGGMENTDKLLNGKYVSKGNPEDSELYTSVRDREMPPKKTESLSPEEQYVIRDWLIKASKTKK
jgi:uncharacterized membrane protein